MTDVIGARRDGPEQSNEQSNEQSSLLLDGGPAVEDGAQPRPTGAVERTLLSLQLLASEPEVRLADVQRRLGVGQSTASRLMAVLVQQGFAEQDPGARTYRAGHRMFDLGRGAVDGTGIVRVVRPALEWLAAESGETAHLGILSGHNIRYLDVIESSEALRVTGRVGRLTPAHATSMGHAMLATFDDESLRRMYAGVSLDAATPRTITDLKVLLAELARVRSRGWARNRQQMESGVCSVGIALVHPARVFIGGVSIATPHARSTPQIERRHVELLMAGRDRMIDLLRGADGSSLGWQSVAGTSRRAGAS